MADTDKLGTRVKKYRENLGLTTEQLAVNSSMQQHIIEDIESGKIYPTVGEMVKISRALGQRLGTFMDDQYVPDPIIVRPENRIEEISSRLKKSIGHTHYFPLGKGKTDRHMEPMFIHMDVDEERLMSTHEGEEFIYILNGTAYLKYGNDEYILKSGDSVYYNAIVKHYIGAKDGSIDILAVMYTPM